MVLDLNIHGSENALLVVRSVGHRLGNYLAGDSRDASGGVPIGFQAVIQNSGIAAFDYRGAGRDRGQQWQDQANRGVKSRELLVIAEGKVDMYALDVGPAVTTAIEDPIIGPVDIRLILGPQHRFVARTHPRVHSRRQKASGDWLENIIRGAYLALEVCLQRFEVRCRSDILYLDYVSDKLVGPSKPAALDVRGLAPRKSTQQLLGKRAHGEGFPVDNGVLQLDPVPGKNRDSPA